ncbi:unnamed protein product [Xylocopa violacea]|uniref:Nuclear envelope membrane protein n=2 Tax=Xylocopa violacea TaxID=135666 RepID=A0ABP1NX59_XYLVO
MFVKYISIITCTICFLYTSYVLCNLIYFLSNHNENKEIIISSNKDENNDSLLWFLITNTCLLSIFMLQHSLMASDFVKHLFCNLHMDYMERCIYNVVSAMVLHLLISKWEVISSVILWNLDTSSNNILWYTFTGFHVFAWSVIYSGCLMMDIAELIGLKQVHYKFSSKLSPMSIKSKELLRYYSHMRHPSFIGFLIILWIYPYMTLDRVLLASILTAYMAFTWTIDMEDYNYHANLVKRKRRELF